MRLYGRRKIKTDVAEITAENVREVIAKAMIEHEYNSNEEDYLWNYYKTKTPILQKTKQYRTDVNNKIVEPRAKQIVEFYLGYVFGEPIQSIRRGIAGQTGFRQFPCRVDARMWRCSENGAPC